MTDNVALKALSQAAKLEGEGRAFYLKAADQARDPKARLMFLSLADDEAKHLGMVTRQLQALEGSGEYVLLPLADVPPIDLGTQLFPPGRERVAATVGTAPDEISALHVAIEREIQSYDLYRQAAQVTASAAGQEMYRWLASAEMAHFNLLMSNYDAILGGRGWV